MFVAFGYSFKDQINYLFNNVGRNTPILSPFMGLSGDYDRRKVFILLALCDVTKNFGSLVDYDLT